MCKQKISYFVANIISDFVIVNNQWFCVICDEFYFLCVFVAARFSIYSTISIEIGINKTGIRAVVNILMQSTQGGVWVLT